MEDINIAFGETVAVRYYGATEEDEKYYATAIAEEDRVYGVTSYRGAEETIQVEKLKV